MTELTVDDVIRMVRSILEDKNNPVDWYISDTPENMAKIWKQPPTSVRINSNTESPVRQTTRMPLNYPLGGKEQVERPPVPQALLTPKVKLEENKDGTFQSKIDADPRD